MNKLATWPGIEFYSSSWEFCNLDGNDALEFMCDVKTPATDAFLAKENREFIQAANPSTVLALLDELEAAEKRIAELQARDINIKRQAQALFEAIANPDDCYIPAYVRCLREALNGYCTGIGVKGE
ncbi:ead/Ea22-like family protein [Citrobacter braakii]|nr:ead/Ea22-like family protein [Citrobacter braakii]